MSEKKVWSNQHANKNYSSGNRVLENLGRLALWLMGGWKLEGKPPRIDKYIIIIAHHTSNWDFVIGTAVMLILRLKVRFFGKHTLFYPPLGWLMKGLGGIAIERHKSARRVEQTAKVIRRTDHFVLLITPEGTRSRVKRWKTGFYHIARSADIPVVPLSFDYRNKRIVFGQPMTMTGNQEHDFREMHRFFLPYQPKHPELAYNGPFEE